MSEKKPELTAEWTVHAQLTISRPNASSTNASGTTDDRSSTAAEPVKVVYKWSTDDQPKKGSTESDTKGPNVSFQKTVYTTEPSTEKVFFLKISYCHGMSALFLIF